MAEKRKPPLIINKHERKLLKEAEAAESGYPSRESAPAAPAAPAPAPAEPPTEERRRRGSLHGASIY